ncbi:MAG: ImmA/IrrE family metallo-endopeptidase [Alphaproteobacteria bacterium]|nr:ImmA/IrrE family metallo-endopeptidase [Alphaproteobacteria bacterium]
MPAGVEGFVPGRLTMAREARALRQTELADLINRSPATVSKYESIASPQRPDPAILPRLAEVLQVDMGWFFKPLVQQEGTAVFYRSLVSELELMRNKARARLGFVEAIEETLSQYVDLPEVDVPDLLEGRDYRTLRREDFDFYAAALRDHWDLGDGPIEDLLLVIENAGIVVAEDEIGSVKLDGVSWWSLATGRPYMLVAQDKNVAVRRRLDAAHEMAHVVLHRYVGPEDLKRDFRLIEEQAMAFAGAFLLPAETFGDEVYSHSLEALVALKSKWKVSVGAMIKRLGHLGSISEHYERRLWQYYSYRKWRAREPLDDIITVEQPQNLRSSIEMLVEDDFISRGELLRETGLSAQDLCSLTGLPTDFFDAAPANLVRLRPSVKRWEDDDENLTSGIIVPFGERRK